MLNLQVALIFIIPVLPAFVALDEIGKIVLKMIENSYKASAEIAAIEYTVNCLEMEMGTIEGRRATDKMAGL